jgi:cytochrome c553
MFQYRCAAYNHWIACDFKVCVSHMKKTLKLLPFLILIGSLASTPAAWSQDVKADVPAGESKAAMCIGCHGIPGYQSSFPEVHKVPMISGQDSKFIVAALNGYAKGERKHPTMRAIAGSLSAQDMADLAAFYAQQPKDVAAVPATLDKPSKPVDELLQKGNCASCHGANLSKPVLEGSPKIAGQHADYLYVALKAYQVSGNPQVGRGNAVMGGIAKQFTHEELRQLSDYLATLPGELRVVPQSRFR